MLPNEMCISNIAKQTILIELNAVKDLLDSIDKDFKSAILMLYNTNGRLIVTGIGKSAIVAQKIVATLNSTGTPSLFMHAADAIHGDLGMVCTNDIVLCISKSGETPEIKVLIPLIKRLGNKLIGMVSNRNAFLAKHADLILYTPIKQEAEPNNLAPTASTTSQMVMGDVIASCLLALRQFSPQDFARFHPGGNIGKKLYLHVNDLCINNPKPCVQEDSSLKDIIIEMTSKRLGATAVVDKTKSIIGIITDGDLRRMLNTSSDIKSVHARDIMTKNPISIQAKELAVNALNLIEKNNIMQLIVLEGDTYVGMLHLHDLIREGII